MTVTTYMIGENEDLFASLVRLDFPISKYINQISIIGAKTKNNRIGIAQFGTSTEKIRICIVPKNVKKTEGDVVGYLRSAIFLAKKHRDHSITFVDNCLFDFALGHRNFGGRLSSLDDFVEFNFLVILDTIQRFFTQHYSKVKKVEKLQLPQLQYEIDLIANISSIEKTSIYQTKTVIDPRSVLASFTILAINYFIKYKCNSISNAVAIKRRALQVSAFLKRRFLDDSKNIALVSLSAKKTEQIFISSGAHQLYAALLKLVSLSSEASDSGNKDSNSLDDVNSIFIRPEQIYQLYAYDFLSTKLFNHHVVMEPKGNYFLSCPGKITKSLESKPDILVTSRFNSERKFIVDVKWKELRSHSEISFPDISKLERDHWVHGACKSALVYPTISPDLLGNFRANWGQDFSFYVLEIPFKFTYAD